MAFTGIPTEIGRAGQMFRGVPENASAPPGLDPAPLLAAPFDGEVPLSDGLVSMHNDRVIAAANFKSSVREGLVATGDALVLIDRDATDVDNRNASSIESQAPSTGGGQ